MKKERLEHISSILMTLNNSNNVNDNEMLICQTLKLSVCGFFVRYHFDVPIVLYVES